MRDYVNIGITPSGEDCVQVSKTENYMPAMRKQAERFKSLLEKAFPPKGRGSLSIKSFPHDFGGYLEVVANFDDTDEESQKWAFDLEGSVPETWAELEKLAGVKPEIVSKFELPSTLEEKDAQDIREHRAVMVDRLPDCDFSHDVKVKATYDGKTLMGPWANMCEKHFHINGVGLGLGQGQRLILRKKDEKSGKGSKMSPPGTVGTWKPKPPGGPITFGKEE